jgi:arsenite methyltransferase
MSSAPSAVVLEVINERYSGLAQSCCSLSCGAALDLAAPGPGEVLVDLGCGRGRDVLRAAGSVGPTGQAIGVDVTLAMLQEARRSVPPFLGNVRFVHCELQRLDLPDALADVVISNCTINHAEDKTAVYREVHRVLRPGGRFVVSDVVAEKALPEEVRADPAAWAACYGGAIPLGEYLQAIRAAGFPEPELLELSDPYLKGGVEVRSVSVRGIRPAPTPPPTPADREESRS